MSLSLFPRRRNGLAEWAQRKKEKTVNDFDCSCDSGGHTCVRFLSLPDQDVASLHAFKRFVFSQLGRQKSDRFTDICKQRYRFSHWAWPKWRRARYYCSSQTQKCSVKDERETWDWHFVSYFSHRNRVSPTRRKKKGSFTPKCVLRWHLVCG